MNSNDIKVGQIYEVGIPTFRTISVYAIKDKILEIGTKFIISGPILVDLDFCKISVWGEASWAYKASVKQCLRLL